jgi:hypothetical protein
MSEIMSAESALAICKQVDILRSFKALRSGPSPAQYSIWKIVGHDHNIYLLTYVKVGVKCPI